MLLDALPPKLIMKIGPLLDALEPGFHCVRAQWIRGFMAFQVARRTRIVMLIVLVCPESGFLDVPGTPSHAVAAAPGQDLTDT